MSLHTITIGHNGLDVTAQVYIPARPAPDDTAEVTVKRVQIVDADELRGVLEDDQAFCDAAIKAAGCAAC